MKLTPDLFDQLTAPTAFRNDRGNPFPIRGLALCFEDGRARVMVHGPCSDAWTEVLSAPVTEPEGVACAIDLTRDFSVVLADLGLAKGPGKESR